tara:strand:+ start:321 stop:776 length:456 start_codon:yes stop_codon:yes gene_type:complete
MKKTLIIVLFLLFSISSYSQQINNIQRGQRGYAPMPKYDSSAYVSNLNIYKELDKILPKCKEEFSLDEFEMQILKGLLIDKMEGYNLIVDNEDFTRDVRLSKLKLNEFEYIKSLNSILSSAEVSRYIEMDFESDNKDKKKKRKKRNKKKQS